MLLNDIKRFSGGLYFIYWKTGVGSLAALGRDENGKLWLAPTDWVKPAYQDDWNFIPRINGIERMDLITTQAEACRKRGVRV